MLGGSSDLDELRAAASAAGIARLTTATDGNHGRAVARMAALLGLEATIYVPAFTARARRDAIAGEGATVVVVPEGYDAAVRASIADAAADPAARAVNDADLDGSSPVGEWVIEGYGTLFVEAAEQLAAVGAAVDAVVLQIGVGAFAAAGTRWAAATGVTAIGAEPAGAACVAASLAAGAPVTLAHSHTTMACLDAESPSGAGWPTLHAAMRAVIVLEDAESDDAMRRLASHGIESGESGAAGMAGLVALLTDPACAVLREGVRSILVVSTEGATDPARYREVVGG
jgi:diaminopropionate ammonia-lyase